MLAGGGKPRELYLYREDEWIKVEGESPLIKKLDGMEVEIDTVKYDLGWVDEETGDATGNQFFEISNPRFHSTGLYPNAVNDSPVKNDMLQYDLIFREEESGILDRFFTREELERMFNQDGIKSKLNKAVYENYLKLYGIESGFSGIGTVFADDDTDKVLNEQEQLELDLPTPIGKFEFPVGYEDIHTETGEEYAGTEQETVDAIKDEVRDEAVTYLFKKWDKTGINFDDLKLLGIPPNNSLTRVMLVKRYLKNTIKQIPVSHTFDCDDLSKMFNTNSRDYDMDYIEEYLCGHDDFWDHQDWYDYEWYDGMSDALDKDNWKTIMKILGVTTQDAAYNLIEDRPQTEEEDRIAEEKEEDINEIRSSITWANNDESEYAVKRAMSEDITDKLAEHFDNEGKLNRDDNGNWSWTIEGNLLDYLEDDMWDNTDLYEYHPDYASTILEDWLMDMTGNIPEAIFESLMLEEFTFEDYDYGKRGDQLETETRYFDGYWQPDYDINDSVRERLGELTYIQDLSDEQRLTQSQHKKLHEVLSGDQKPFTKKESIILKQIHKNFDKSELQSLTDETPSYGGTLESKWQQLMKYFGIPTSTQEDAAASTQYAKYALDNWTKDGNYDSIEKPIKDKIGWWDIDYRESGSQIEYKSGNVNILAFNDDDAEEKGADEFWDWDGETEVDDWGDYEAYDSSVEDVTFTDKFADLSHLDESATENNPEMLSDMLPKIWDKHGPTLEPRVLKLYGIDTKGREGTRESTTRELRKHYIKYLGGRKQVEKDIREILPKVSSLVVCGGYEFGIFDTNIQVYEDGSITVDTIIDPNGEVTLIETDWEGKPITLKLADIANEDYWGITKHPFRNPKQSEPPYNDREWDEQDYYEWEHIWGEVDMEIADCITGHFGKEIGKRFGSLELSAEYAFGDTDNFSLNEGVAGDQERHKKEQGDFFTLDGSENLGNTDIFKDDGFDIIHQYRGDVHLSDLSPEESETVIPQGSKKVKKTVLKPRLDKGPFNIPVPMKEHYDNIADNPDLNPEVEEGDIIELLYMEDPYSIPIKTKGIVMGFEGKPGDFAYKLLVNWILGPEKLSPMALLPDVDVYRFPKKSKGYRDEYPSNLKESYSPQDKDLKYTIQDIVDEVYPHIVNNLGPSRYVEKSPSVELWKDIYARYSGEPKAEGEHSSTSKAEYVDEDNVIYVYYPNMEDTEDVIRSLLHEYTHSLQDPDKRTGHREAGYEKDPDEIAAAKAELDWEDYLIHLKDNLNEQFEKPYNDPKAIVNGKEIQLDVADTEFLKQKGMMYKTSYPKNRGMLFLWDDIVPISMWMRNTLLPLDIVYMVDGEVVDYDKDVQPCEEQQCDTYGRCKCKSSHGTPKWRVLITMV